MELYSTNQKAPNVNLKEALFRGLPPDNGLYMPTKIPVMSDHFYNKIGSFSLPEIAFQITKKLLGDEINEKALKNIVYDAINFDAPLEILNEYIYILELFHGPTMAFKDFGARFMARLMAYFLEQDNQPVNILVATSGDTGSAVAHGFLGIDGVRVIILYPKGKVSEIQEKQFTTLGKNVIALEVDGNFDDCQKLVKQSFLDEELNKKIRLTSANSINIGRLIPQSFYYFNAYAKLKTRQRSLVFSVPSGNFGNLCGGLIAKRMGLPVEKFIAATNVNDVVPKYLLTGEYKPAASIKTLSSAMDVGSPSNFVRILDLYGHNYDNILKDVRGASFTDEQTREIIYEVSGRYEYTLDPHTAVGYLGLSDYFHQTKNKEAIGIVLATAHPSKFIDIVEDATGSKIIIPERMRKLINRKKLSVPLKNDFDHLKQFLFTMN